jgi:hypothetical protein
VDYEQHIQGSGYEYIQFARDHRGDTARLYRVRSLPATYLLDREGVIKYSRTGFGRGLERRLEDEIAGLLD